MRKIFALALSGMLLTMVAGAQSKSEALEGNGKVVTRDVPVSSFDALKASGIYELKLIQGNKESVRIEADENLHDLFQVRNEGSSLVIDMKKLDSQNKNLKVKTSMKVYVTFKSLKNLELSTIGNVTSEDKLTFDDLRIRNKSIGLVDLQLTANKVDVENKSVGNVKLTGKAQDAVVRNSGVGSLEAADFVVQTMNIENTGVGNAEVNAEKNLTVKDSFMGKVKNKGAATARKMNRVRV
jgi:hypothetical protein